MHIRWIKSMISGVVLMLVAGAAGHAWAQASDPSAPKTRAQVRAELVEAQRTGNIMSLNSSGKMLNELYPNRYRSR